MTYKKKRCESTYDFYSPSFHPQLNIVVMREKKGGSHFRQGSIKFSHGCRNENREFFPHLDFFFFIEGQREIFEIFFYVLKH